MATEKEELPAQLPHLEVLNRVREFPVVELAINKSADTYSRVKDSHQFVYWALSTAESSLNLATKTALPIATPIAKKFETPIKFVDDTLCHGLNKIEEKVPIVKKKPEMILEDAYMMAIQSVQPTMSRISYANDLIIAQASSIKDVSWNKVNEMLDTSCGTAALQSIDATATAVDALIEKYFPPTGEEHIGDFHSTDEDKLLRTLQTVGRLSNKAARRVYSNVVLQLSTLKADNLKMYVSSVVEFLHLTRYLEAANEKVQAFTEPSTQDSEKKTD